nr:hypothetical protein [Methylobacterium radiotolerans]
MIGVILNLAVWFAIHTVFAEVLPFAGGPLRIDAPVLASLDPNALGLAAVAVQAVFRLKVAWSRSWLAAPRPASS